MNTLSEFAPDVRPPFGLGQVTQGTSCTGQVVASMLLSGVVGAVVGFMVAGFIAGGHEDYDVYGQPIRRR